MSFFIVLAGKNSTVHDIWYMCVRQGFPNKFLAWCVVYSYKWLVCINYFRCLSPKNAFCFPLTQETRHVTLNMRKWDLYNLRSKTRHTYNGVFVFRVAPINNDVSFLQEWHLKHTLFTDLEQLKLKKLDHFGGTDLKLSEILGLTVAYIKM